ncbi:VRR-NUC domain-containing protein [Tellurirhabdus bombi]|uniref:VRR-NUC domain-containing protein n=1 Tax=Tellurirhabdus bombi TaxID=2907205 RepID=UPI001F3DF73C|nr:VRR-NUC domain-containing protein [Tellurirhabdus bombi]
MTAAEYQAHAASLNYVPRSQPKARKKPGNLESGLQVACVRWFRDQYRESANLLFAIPNGGHRNKAVAAKLKHEGVLAGVPDLMLAKASGAFHGLFVELKVQYANGQKNTPSPEQKQRIKELKEQGYFVAVCYELNQFIEVVNTYLHP